MTIPPTDDAAVVTTTESVELLKPDRDNARSITAEAAKGLGVSMHDFGDLSGIVWNELLGSLVSGHQRMGELLAAGATSWERLSPDEGVIVHPVTGERFRIRVVRWAAAKHRAANLAANNPHIAGEFTDLALAQIQELAKEGDALLASLRLDVLQQELAAKLGEWESDISDVTKHGENTDGLDAEIVITCPQAMRQLLLEKLTAAVVASAIEGVSID